MRQTGEYRIGAGRDLVWRALNDPDVLRSCIDGCQSMTRTGDDAFQAVVKAKVGPVSALFTAEFKLADLNPPTSYTLQGSVKGGAAGFGKGAAKVDLSDDGPATLLRYQLDASIGGKLAQVGQRLIDGAARKTADDFFARFAERLAARQGEATAPPASLRRPKAPFRFAPTLVAAVIAVAAITAVILLKE